MCRFWNRWFRREKVGSAAVIREVRSETVETIEIIEALPSEVSGVEELPRTVPDRERERDRPEELTTSKLTVKREPSSSASAEVEEIRDRPDAAYADYKAYLRDELTRVDLLLKAHLVRKRVQIHHAGQDPIRAVTAAGFEWTEPIADVDGRWEVERLSRRASRLERTIVRCLRLTDARIRGTFPLWELTRMFHLVPGLSELFPLGITPAASGVRPERDTTLLDVLLLAILVDRFPRYHEAILTASERGLTTGILLEILHPELPPTSARWDHFAIDGPLAEYGLIEMSPAESPSLRAVRIDPRVADFVLGLSSRDAQLPGTRLVFEARLLDRLLLDPDTVAVLKRISVRWWDRTNPLKVVMLFHGPAGGPFLSAAQAFLTAIGKTGQPTTYPILLVETADAIKSSDWVASVRRVYREARLNKAAVFWNAVEGLLGNDQDLGRWEVLIREAERYANVTFLTSEASWDPVKSFVQPDHYYVRVEFPIPGPDVRRAIWKHQLARENNPISRDDTPDRHNTLDLLETFPFTQGQVEAATATARGLALAGHPGTPVPTAEELYEGCRRLSARRLVSFAHRIQPRPGQFALADVVLPPASATLLKELLDRMRSFTRVYHDLGFEKKLSLGRGLVALFTGPSGTGKTHAATVLASLVGKDLYKVDVAAVVSKFVGDTEKNLNRIFADAQDANAVLFFDEADALFGKRGSVEQGQDRWANLEVNFLLQRVEEYTGTVILATNFRQNIDDAFLRRIQVLLDFPLPDKAAKLNILKRMFPPEIDHPDDTILADLVGKLDLTGGNIKNAVLDAAFRAAATTPPNQKIAITLHQLVLGFAREYQKLNKPITAATFGKACYEKVVSELSLGQAATSSGPAAAGRRAHG